jgi:hypothetical protein
MKQELLMGDDVADRASIGWTIIVDDPTETTRVRFEENRGERFGRSLATWLVILTAGVLLGANLQSVAGVPRIAADGSPVVDQSLSAERSVKSSAAPRANPAAARASSALPPCIPFDYRPVACPRSSAANTSTRVPGSRVWPN